MLLNIRDMKMVGCVDVDAGMVWIGDPCYILQGDRPKDTGKDWEEFCDILESKGMYDYNNGRRVVQFNHDLGHAGLGVVSSAGYGDGTYNIYARYNDEGRVMQLVIDFEGYEEEDCSGDTNDE